MSSRPASDDFAARFPSKPLSACLESVKVPAKIPRSSFLSDGKLPIVSQEADLINGYWDNEADAIRVGSPVVIFGDHTQVLKLIDFDFVVGADGVKILKPKEFLDAAFLRYFLEANPIPSLGYARHYRHISGIDIPLPPLDEQERIVAVLDQAFVALDRARTHAEANLADVEGLLADALDKVFLDLAAVHPVLPLEDAVHADCKLSYGIVQPGEELEVGLPVVRPVDLKQRVIRLDGLKRIAPDRAKGYARTMLVGDELLLCVRGSTGAIAMASPDLKGGNVTRGIVPVRFDSAKVIREFAYFQFLSHHIREQIAAGTYGAALMQINIKDLRQLGFVVPDVSVQRETVARAESMYEVVQKLRANYSRKLADIVDFRQSLLQKALSGQLT